MKRYNIGLSHIFDDVTMVTDEEEGAAIREVELHSNKPLLPLAMASRPGIILTVSMAG